MVIEDAERLIARASALAHQGGRRILGIAGPPGGGKSTVARQVAAELGGLAGLVPRAASPLAKPELVGRGGGARRGARDTSAAAGYAALPPRLRGDEPVVYAPEFRREIEE